MLLICDEVATGFGRTGTLFASEQRGLRPDLLCLGKGMTAGYLPMSATVASGRVFDAFLGDDLGERTLYHGHSYGGNALAAAVALRHLELIDAWDVLANVRERSDELRGLLHDRVASKPAVREVRLEGLMGGVELAPPGRRPALGPPGVGRRGRARRAARARSATPSCSCRRSRSRRPRSTGSSTRSSDAIDEVCDTRRVDDLGRVGRRPRPARSAPPAAGGRRATSTARSETVVAADGARSSRSRRTTTSGSPRIRRSSPPRTTRSTAGAPARARPG